MTIALGIDLGTTNSAASVLIDGRVEMILIDGQKSMPSCVGIDGNGGILVGQPALNQYVASPDKTVLSIKRLMGSDKGVTLGDTEFTPEEISALILKRLKAAAEQSLGTTIEKAVITVPAYFNDSERLATKNAGKLAGLDVLRVINEPTSAAIAYDSEHSQEEKLLVYDLGGGTFDVSLVVVHNGLVEVKSSHGDTKLGGDDFDSLLVEHVISLFEKEHDITIDRSNASILNRLKLSLEKAKCHLSDHPYAQVKEEFLSGDKHLDIELSRADYEDLIRPLIEKTLEAIQKCFSESGIYSQDIDRIMLVGGSSRTPLVHEMIKEKLKAAPRFEIDPDLIVAMGAGIQAGILCGQKSTSILIDITSYTFGTKTMDVVDENGQADFFSPLISKNSPIPVSKSQSYFAPPFSSTISMDVYQGESSSCSQNELVGQFKVEGLRVVNNENDSNIIVITFALDINGMLEVTALEKSTGLSKTVNLDTNDISNNFDMDESQAKLGAFEVISNDTEKDSTEDIKDNPLFKRFEKLDKDELDSDDIEEVEELLAELKSALEDQDEKLIDEKSTSLADLLFYLED